MYLPKRQREQTVMMARIRNEARWIQRCMARTWQVANTCVIWDDGSDDETMDEVIKSFGDYNYIERKLDRPSRSTGAHVFFHDDGRVLHYVHSPYRITGLATGVAIPYELMKYQVNEIRDKNTLWEYVKSRTLFKYVLCMDGDEMLSLALLRSMETWYRHMDVGIDLFHLPFVYLWDNEDTVRIDAIYGKGSDGVQVLNFPRLFTTQRWTEQEVFDSHFAWEGTKGGFHCGSLPRSQAKSDMVGGLALDPIIHFGYLHEHDRQRKFVFYNEIDPGNVFEGEYKHIIGQPNQHAPGPVQLVVWQDA